MTEIEWREIERERELSFFLIMVSLVDSLTPLLTSASNLGNDEVMGSIFSPNTVLAKIVAAMSDSQHNIRGCG